MGVTLAITLLIAGIALGLSASRIIDGRDGLDRRVQALEVLACGFLQFEDYSVMYQADDNARETCPLWPGQPIVAHWGSPDPAAVEGTDSEKYRAFKDVALQINRRIQLLTSLPLDKLDQLKLAAAIQEIGTK